MLKACGYQSVSIFPSANILGDCPTKRLTAQLLIVWKLAWEWRGWQQISSKRGWSTKKESTNNSTDTTKSSPYLRLFHIFLRLRISAGKTLWHANVHLWSPATLCQSPTLHYADLTQRIPHKSKHSSIALTFILQISETKKSNQWKHFLPYILLSSALASSVWWQFYVVTYSSQGSLFSPHL